MQDLQRFLTKYFRQIGTPLAKQAEAYAVNGEWSKLQELRLGSPSSYTNAESFKLDAMVTEIFRKSLLPGDTEARTKAAVSTFWASETQCKETNLRLSRYQSNTQNLRDSVDVAVDDFIGRWRKELKSVLGPCRWGLDPRFSGGSTLSDDGLRTTIPDKMSSVPTCYEHGVDLYQESFARTPQGEAFFYPDVVRGNRFFTVPKNSQTDRGCCVEASSSVSLQLAVGHGLKGRFHKSYRYRLQYAPTRHRRLARVASAGRRALATIDLSNASDTVAYGLIQLLMPHDWLCLLNSLRASHSKIDGRWVRLEKFSSMGNGFTFELETLIFKTLCDTIIGSRSSYAFGDDLIVPMDRSADIIAALRFFGFTPNEKKTFCEGPFRESCGGDFFNGEPVRAHYIKDLPSEPQQWIALMNGLRRVDPSGTYTSAAWHHCLDMLPKNVRECRGPSTLGDIVIHDAAAKPTFRAYSTPGVERCVDKFGEVFYKRKKYANSPTWFFRVYRPVSRTFDLGKHFTYRVATAAASLGVPSQVAPRESISGHKLDWVPAYGRNDGFGWIDLR